MSASPLCDNHKVILQKVAALLGGLLLTGDAACVALWGRAGWSIYGPLGSVSAPHGQLMNWRHWGYSGEKS